LAEKPGTLYLCATPIGNLEDMTLRAIRILKEVSVIAAEDTRYTRRLLTHFDIHTPLISYHEHNKASRGPELIARLAAGEDIAVVSDAGLPGISDPGADLVRLALPEGIAAVPLPGCNAALSALICSGLDSTMFTFVGFLPKTKKKRREFLENLAKNPYTLLMYEAPHRLRQTLNELHEILGDRPAVAARELTKRFEQFVRGTIGTLQDHFTAHLPRGEFTLVIAGCPAAAAAETAMDTDEVSLQDAVFALVAQGTDKKNAIRIIAEQRSLPKRVVYQAVLDAGK